MSKIGAVITLFIVSSLFSSCALMHLPELLPQAGKWKHTASVSKDSVIHAPQPILLPVDTILTAQTKKDQSVFESAALQNKRIQEVSPVWAKRLHYSTFAGKAKINFSTADDSKDFTANFRIKKDSVIWVQITALGGLVQAARVCITADSFFMVNYIDREYMRLPLSQIARVLPANIEFASLQNMITGDPLREGAIKKVCDTGNRCTIVAEDNGYIQNVCYNMADSTMESGLICTHSAGGPNALIRYIHYELLDGRKLSTARTLSVNNGKDNYAAEIDFVNMDFDKPLEFPFSIPKNFSEKK